MAKKLTKAQARDLQLVANGNVYYDTWVIRYRHTDDHSTIRTGGNLQKLGYIKQTATPRAFYYNVELTDAGRAALAAAQPATASAKTAATWMPAVWDRVRVKQSGAIGTVTAIDTSSFGAEYYVYSIVDGNGEPILDNCDCDFMLGELEPASAAPAQPERVVTVDDDFEPDGAGIDFGKDNQIETLRYDIGILNDHIAEQDAALASAREQIAALTSERDALYKLIAEIRVMGQPSSVVIGDVLKAKREAASLFDHKQPRADPDAAMLSARAAADDGARYTVDDIDALFVDGEA